MLYQDAVADPIQTASDDRPSASDRLSSLRQHHDTARLHRLIAADELNAHLPHHGSAARDRVSASVVPLVHHAARHHETHSEVCSDQSTPVSWQTEVSKRALDVFGAVALALALSPVLLVVGLALSRDRGAIIYSHSRTGRHGKAFGCLRFRTMVPNADSVMRELLQNNPELRQE